MSMLLKNYIHTILLFIAMMSCMMLSACFDDNYSDCLPVDAITNMDAYFVLNISTTNNEEDRSEERRVGKEC